VKVLDIESDADHNRSVLSIAGAPAAVKEAALAISAKAIELIDLNKHEGQHPRMGAVDVVPFIPIANITMDECVALAKEFGEEYATKFGVPVYLYEEAATRPDRKNLADVRKGEFEGLREEIGKNPDRVPDFGPNRIHHSAGATAVGARRILIAYNINLGTTDLAIAKQIAKQIRGRDGGFAGVKALGFELKDRGMVQVSMNMVDYKTSQLFKVFELVRSFADRYGVPVIASEIVGLVPMDALTDSADFYLRLHGFSRNQILEQRLIEKDPNKRTELDLVSFVNEVASDKPVPGGGSVSAYSASLASGLVSMVARLTLSKNEDEITRATIRDVLTKSESHQRRLIELVDEDSISFTRLIQAYRLPKSNDEQQRIRKDAIQRQLKEATEVPLTTSENAIAVVGLAKQLAADANMNAISDLQTAVYLAEASARGAFANVSINLAEIKDAQYQKQTLSKVATLQSQLEQDKFLALENMARRAKMT
jgi:glutamate formiminotransferase/formiminotetrahydrofolate cyclodeaminase